MRNCITVYKSIECDEIKHLRNIDQDILLPAIYKEASTGKLYITICVSRPGDGNKIRSSYNAGEVRTAESYCLFGVEYFLRENDGVWEHDKKDFDEELVICIDYNFPQHFYAIPITIFTAHTRQDMKDEWKQEYHFQLVKY